MPGALKRARRVPKGTDLDPNLTYNNSVKSRTQPRIIVSFTLLFLAYGFQSYAQCSVNAGPDLVRCLNQSVSLGVGLTFTGQAPVTFNWSGTISDIQNPTFAATNAMAGTHIVTITDANGCTASDNIVLTVNPLPVVNAGADVSICPDTPTNLCATASSANGAISMFLWQGGPMTQCRTVSPTTTPSPYSLTVTDVLGCQASDAVQVTVLPVPGANAGNDQSICLGNGAVQLIGVPTGGIWSGTGVNASGLFTPSNTGTFTLTYTTTGSNSCTSTDQVVITVTNPNPPDGGPDIQVCQGTAPFQLPNVGTWNGSTYVTPSGVFTPTHAGTYNLFVTASSGGCNTSDNIVVQVLSLPNVNAGNDQTICTSTSVNLSGSASSANGAINGIAWTGGWVSNATILNPTTTPSANTTYQLTVTDAAGCMNTDFVTISLAAYPSVNAGADQTICSNSGAVQMTGASPAGGTWSGSGITSSGSYTPSAISQFTVTYTFTNAAGCTASDNKVITVIAPAAVNAGPDQQLCQGGPTVTLQSGGTWSGSNFVQSNGVFNPAQAGTYSLTYTTTSGGCTATDQIVITVNALPVVNAGSDAAICANQNYSLNGTASSPNGNITSIHWTGNNIADTEILNPIVSPTVTSTYELTIVDAAGCSASDQIVVTLNPLPVVSAGPDVVLCSNAGASTLSGQSPSGGLWSGPQVSNAGVFTPTLDGTYTLTYTFALPNGCSVSDTRIITVISPLPVNAGADITVCEDTPSFALASGGTWTGSSYVTSAGNFNPTQPGVYNLTYTTTSNNCSISDQLTVQVLAAPNAQAGQDVSGCVGATIQLNGSSSTTSNGTITNYSWSNGLTGPSASLTAANSQNLTLTVTDASGCTDTDQVSINVLALPTVYAGSDITLCNQPSPYTLTDYAPAGGTWSGSGVTANGIFTPSGIGSFVLSYCVTGTNGCQECDQLTVSVNAAPTNNAGADIQLCQNSGSIALTPITPGGTWTGSGVTSNGTFNPTTVGSFVLNYTMGSGWCQSSDQIVVTVNPAPIVAVASTFQACSGSPVQLSATTTGGLAPYFYAWNNTAILSNASVSNPLATTTSDTNLALTVTDYRGCSVSANTVIDVVALPVSQFSIPSQICQNTNVPITNTSSFASSYSWSFGNSETSTAATPTVDYNLPGVYQIQLIVSNALGCSHTSSQSITVLGAPQAAFALSANDGCSPLTVFVDNTSLGAITSNQWLVQGSFNTNAEPGSYTLTTQEVISTYPITLTVSNQCGSDTETHDVTVHPRPIAMFATDLSSQCSPVTTHYMNLSSGNPTSYHWNLGDGQTTNDVVPQTNVYVTEEESANFNIKLVAANACGVDSTEQSVLVLPNTVHIDLESSVTSGCSPLFVQFNNQTTGATNYTFDFGNNVTSNAQNPNYVFETPGEHHIRMVADDGCSYDTTEVAIQVNQSPTLVIGTDLSEGCPGTTVQFYQSTTGNITHIDWSFGDEAIAQGENPSHTYVSQNTYLASATAFDYNGCTVTNEMPITIFALPEPHMIMQNIEACSPWQLCPENATINGDTYHWASGLTTSDEESPCFTFVNGTEEPITRTIVLTAWSEHGCEAMTSADIVVLPQPQLVVGLSTYESCAVMQPVQTQVVANSTDSFQWYVNDAAASNETEPTFLFDAIGEYTIQLVAMNDFGCSNDATSTYEIHPLPVIDIMPEVMNGCPPLMINFDNTTSNGSTYAWQFSNGVISNAAFPTITFEQTGVYDVQLTAMSEHGCESVASYEDMIEVYPLPVSQFTYDPNDEVIYELDVQFNNASQGAVQYQWNFGDDTYSTLASPIHEYVTGGFYTVTLTAQNEYGCVDKSVQGVNIDDTFYTFIPNAFTPNNDGINDTFGPVFSSTQEIRSYRFYVKNKWGEIIFETDNPNEHWRGNDNSGGWYLHNDVFAWVVEIEYNNNKLHKLHEGTIVLVR